MKIIVDTNLLVRVATWDNEDQSAKARDFLTMAEAIVVPLPCILEFVWVLRSVYRFSRDEVAQALGTLIDSRNVIADDAAIRAGLHVYAAGGDFADGVIAASGAAMGGDTFVSFDRKAVARIRSIGIPAELATSLA